MAVWSIDRIPPQQRRLAIVTGGTDPLGTAIGLALAGAGAQVVLAGRDRAKGTEAVAQIEARCPFAHVTFEPLDLASLASVQDFAERMTWENSRIDLLVNHAEPARREGVARLPGAAPLGHFALTLRLLPRLLAAAAPRVVTLGGAADPRPDLFALELDRRARAEGWRLASLAAHAAPKDHPIDAALPAIFAATCEEAEGGVIHGAEGPVPISRRFGPDAAAQLWAASERLTGLSAEPLMLAA